MYHEGVERGGAAVGDPGLQQSRAVAPPLFAFAFAGITHCNSVQQLPSVILLCTQQQRERTLHSLTRVRETKLRLPYPRGHGFFFASGFACPAPAAAAAAACCTTYNTTGRRAATLGRSLFLHGAASRRLDFLLFPFLAVAIASFFLFLSRSQSTHVTGQDSHVIVTFGTHYGAVSDDAKCLFVCVFNYRGVTS